MIYLDKNENQYGPSPRCYEIVKNISTEMFSSYSRDYPKKIKERLGKEFKVNPDSIMIGYGSEDILREILQFFVKGGDRVLIPDESWWYYKHLADELRAEKVLYHMDEKEDRFEWNIDRIIEQIRTHHPRIVLICSPNNPTGNSITLEGLQRLMKETGDNNIVILDEAYWGFTTPLFSDEHCIEGFKNLAILRTFSKFYALAGQRIGFAFIGDYLKDVAKYSERYLGYNRISEELTFAVLDSKEYYMSCAGKIQKDAKKIFDFFKSVGAKPFLTDANFILIRLTHPQFKKLKEGMGDKDIVIKFFSEKVFDCCIRISIGTEEQTAKLLKYFKAILG